MGAPKRHIDTFNQIIDESHPQFVSAVARAFSSFAASNTVPNAWAIRTYRARRAYPRPPCRD